MMISPTIKKLIFSTLPILFLTLTACSNQQQRQFNPFDNSIFTREQTQNDLLPAPDFTLETMEGTSFTLSEQKGKIVILNIWATWCAPCREEIPDFMEIQEEMEEHLLFVGVSVDEKGWDVVVPFAEEFEINYPIVLDDGTVSEKYGPIMGIPMSFIINEEGDVAYVIPGMIRKELLQRTLQEMIAENQLTEKERMNLFLHFKNVKS